MFLVKLSCADDLPKEDTGLVNVKQEEGESNLEYFVRFKKVHKLIASQMTSP